MCIFICIKLYFVAEGLTFERLIADRGYAAQSFVDYLTEHDTQVVIPPHQRAKALREFDTWLYRERHLVECFINKIKHFRRIFSRFEKLDRSYLGFLHFVGSLIWLR
jgi:transposase